MEDILLSEIIWNRIVINEGETFHQIKGKPFTYKIHGNVIDLQTTNRKIPKTDIQKALLLAPLESTAVVQHLQAPSYIYAIIMDERICGRLW